MANMFFRVKCCKGLKNIILNEIGATRNFAIRFKCRLFDTELCQDQMNL